MLITEPLARTTRRPAARKALPHGRTIRHELAIAASQALAAARTAGSPRAWATLALTWWVLAVAILNLARFGLER